MVVIIIVVVVIVLGIILRKKYQRTDIESQNGDSPSDITDSVEETVEKSVSFITVMIMT